MKLPLWILILSLFGIVVIFAYVVFLRPDFLLPDPVSENDRTEISRSILDKMYPSFQTVLNEDCYYVQVYMNNGKIKVLKSEKAKSLKSLSVEDVIKSVSERPYGYLFMTDKLGMIAANNFIAFQTGCQ